jgi:hypothetical protein
MLKIALAIIIAMLSNLSYAGSLFSFDKNIVQMAGLQYIQSKYQDLAQSTLTAFQVQTIVMNGKLLAIVNFSYKSDNESGTAYTCAIVDENSNLIAIARDIPAAFSQLPGAGPDYFGCVGAP